MIGRLPHFLLFLRRKTSRDREGAILSHQDNNDSTHKCLKGHGPSNWIFTKVEDVKHSPKELFKTDH